MNSIRGWTSLAAVLCLSSTAVAQHNPLREQAPAYGYGAPSYATRLSRLDDRSSRGPMTEAPSYQPSAASGPIDGASAPEQVATPQPIYGNPGSIFDEAFGGGDCGSDCGCCFALPSFAGGGTWYGYVGGLTMGRNTPNRFWTTYEAGNNPNQLMYFPGADWGGGVDTRIGYWFGCGCGDPCNPCGSCGGRAGIEAIYWGVWGLDGQSSLYDPSDSLSTPIDLGLVYFDNPITGQALDYFDNARSHRLTRNDEVHNVELNLLYIPCCDPCNRFQLTALAGVRYFRFTEGLQFGTLAGSAPVGAQFGEYPADEAYLDVNVQNNLVGFQIGAYGNYQIANRFSIFAVPKIGIFGNHITAHNSLYTGSGVPATFQLTGNQFDIRNSRNVFSMLGSIDVGFNWAFTQNCSLIGGYRVVAVSNLALSDNQIPAYLAAEDEWNTISANGDLILHGAFAGLEVRF